MSKITLHGEEVSVGDRVWSLRKGWGSVIDVTEHFDYPIKVAYEGDLIDSYTERGLFSRADKMPELHWDEIKIVPPKKPLPPVYEYLVVYEHRNMFAVSSFWYISFDEFSKSNTTCGKPLSLIEESKRVRK